ncbi:mannose-1-phosphate guanylyltransferase [candidate division KSB1 bacterium]|nr:mannose-1-phosphate guanylyltransferase [candidate division KSB1 bacterium]
MENSYALIMAGGIGSRFWPKSRQRMPKQFLNLVDRQSMIQSVSERIQSMIPKEKIFVVSTREHVEILQKQLSWLLPSQIIYEPYGKNTAPCIGLSAIVLSKRDPDAIMIVLPADHLITETKLFQKTLQQGLKLIEQNPDVLVTIGITPTFAATGYGYIQKGEKQRESIYRVKKFIEKPKLDKATKIWRSGDFLWNSGIFIWRAGTILDRIHKYMPDLFFSLQEIVPAIGSKDMDQVLKRVYKNIKSESIDYGIMEKSENVLVIEGSFGWNDVGSWEEVYKVLKKDSAGNVSRGKAILKDVKNSYIESSDRVVAVVGLENIIVVDTPDALLICAREKSQDVKWIVEKLKKSDRKKHL